MYNILLTGVGGQGTVLAAKILAQAAQNRGWQVRTAETIGMSQRGGSVVSYLSMGDQGEEVFTPMLAQGTADLIVAFEPAEGARVLSYLKSGGYFVTASTAIQPVTAALSDHPYTAEPVLDELRELLDADHLAILDESAILDQIGSRKVLNTVMLAATIQVAQSVISIDDLKEAIRICVKPRFVDLNLGAIDATVAALQ